MKGRFCLLATISLLLIAQSPLLAFSPGRAQEGAKPPAQRAAPEGIWQGTLSAGGASIKLIFKVSKAPDGSLIARLNSPAQGVMDLPVDTATVRDGTVRFEINRAGVVYEGALSADGTEISGKWMQNGASLPLVLRRADKEEKPNRPQEPKKPYPYNEEEVIYENKKAGIRLAGTLTLPRSKGPFPAVILISGSDAQDRDESLTLVGHKPFLVLADYLTRQGLAVLRLDDRGVGGSTGDTSRATTEDFADDALSGVDYLRGRKEINPKRIGLIGHSEGAAVASLAAAKSTDVAFIVMMGGAGLTGEEVIYLQAASLARAGGADDKRIAEGHAAQERIFAVLKTEKDPVAAEKKLRTLMTEDQKNGGSEAVEAELKRVLTPWFRFFLTYDPRSALMKVKCPVLALNGDHDWQVPYQENLAAIEAALKAAGKQDYTILKLPNLNHLFQTSQSGSPAEYGNIEETISPAALQVISDWIQKHMRQER